MWWYSTRETRNAIGTDIFTSSSTDRNGEYDTYKWNYRVVRSKRIRVLSGQVDKSLSLEKSNSIRNVCLRIAVVLRRIKYYTDKRIKLYSKQNTTFCTSHFFRPENCDFPNSVSRLPFNRRSVCSVPITMYAFETTTEFPLTRSTYFKTVLTVTLVRLSPTTGLEFLS